MNKITTYRSGLILAGLLGLTDLVTIFTTATPPMFVLILSALVGVATIIGVVMLWREYSKGWFWTVVVSRILSALSAIPVLFISEDDAGDPISTGLRVTVAIFLVLTIAALGLLFKGRPAQQSEISTSI